jgi:hypothetical protein
MRRLLPIFVLLAAPVMAQTVAVDRTVTHQTWKATQINVRPCYDNPDGAYSPTTAEQDTILNDFVYNLNVNAHRIGMPRNKITLETTNDDGDPLTHVATPFNTAYTTTYSFSPCNNSFSVQNDATIGKVLRLKASAFGFTPETHMRVTGVTTLTNANNPTFIRDGADLAHAGEKEAWEVFEEMAEQVRLDQGYCVTSFEINEPVTTGSPQYFGASTNYASWFGGLAVEVAALQPNSNCPLPLFMGPTQANSDANTKARLDNMAGVTGGVSSMGRTAVHCYSEPTAATWTTIYTAYPSLPAPFMSECDWPTGGKGYADSRWTVAGFPYVYTVMMDGLNDGNMVGAALSSNTAENCDNADVGCPDTSARAGVTHWDAANAAVRKYYRTQSWYAAYLLHHFALVPGNVRVDCPVTGSNVRATCWLNADSALVMVAGNNLGSAQTVTVTGLNNVVHDSFMGDPSQCVTTGDARCTLSVTTKTPSGGSTSLSVPTKGIWVLVERTATVTRRTAF